MEMGEKIKYHRELLHMTLEELGNKVGVGKSTVRKWENGMIANMKRDKIAKVANALDISPGYLMGWTDDPDPKAVTHLQVGDCEPEEITLHDEYYADAQTALFAQQLLENKEMRMLFDAAKNSKPEDLTMVTEMLKRLKGTNPDG